jgi:hypothetical protein
MMTEGSEPLVPAGELLIAGDGGALIPMTGSHPLA